MTLLSWLHGLFLFTTVFSVGVTAIDMLGLFSPDHSASTADTDTDTSADDLQVGDSAPLLSILRYLRMGIYFALGFGPVGLMAEWTGTTALVSLAWAIPSGVVSAGLARWFFQFQQEDIDSRIPEAELLLEHAQVIVPLSKTNMGKVRVTLGQLVMERYARAEDEKDSFKMNDQVEIVRVTDDCLYVRRTL